MGSVNKAGSVSEISSRPSFLCKISMCSYERPVASVGLCRHNFEHNTISGASGIIKVGIILIFLQYNAVVSETVRSVCKFCLQQLAVL